MTKYQYLLSKKESGELSILFNHFELPLKFQQWMDIYTYHLEHPELNYIQLSNDKKCGTTTICRALSFMNQEVRWSFPILGTDIS